MKIVIEDAEERVETLSGMGSTTDIRKDPLEIAFSNEGGIIQIQLLGRTFEVGANQFRIIADALCDPR